MPISSVAAAQAAERGLERIDLNGNPDVAAAHRGGHAGVPLFVARLDQPDRHYYLVPWVAERGITLLVQVDASSGEMSSFAVLPVPVRQLVMSPDEAKRAAEARLGRRATGDPKLVWRPSRESASPLQPLYQVPMENGQAFVGVHHGLTSFGRGG
jgi:hypothetical protein